MKLLNVFPQKIRLWFIIFGGVLCGLLIYVIYVSHAYSYLSDDPKACVNCHVMSPEFATWQHSSHREVAVCNDCHVPHNNFLNKYFFKAKDGLYHATIFTLNAEPQVIRMRNASANVVQQNCERCHFQLNQKINNTDMSITKANHGEGKMCWECHRETPHGSIHSQGSITNRMGVPLMRDSKTNAVPEWLGKIMQQ